MDHAKLNDLVEEVKRRPGLTISKYTLALMDKDGHDGDVLARYIAEHSDTDLEWDEYANPRFMPKDPEKVAEIRAGWKSIGIC